MLGGQDVVSQLPLDDPFAAARDRAQNDSLLAGFQAVQHNVLVGDLGPAVQGALVASIYEEGHKRRRSIEFLCSTLITVNTQRPDTHSHAHAWAT